MSTTLLKSKAFNTLLSGDFPLPAPSGCGWFFEQKGKQKTEFRRAVRAFVALGARAVALMAEVVANQDVPRSKISKIVEDLENQGLIFITEEPTCPGMPYHIHPSLLGEDVLLAVDDLLLEL